MIENINKTSQVPAEITFSGADGQNNKIADAGQTVQKRENPQHVSGNILTSAPKTLDKTATFGDTKNPLQR